MGLTIVWVVGAGGDQRLYGYNGDTGALIYAGGGPNELMANTRKWNTGIVARGHIYFAALGRECGARPDNYSAQWHDLERLRYRR
jgi:hypothetical protein